MTNRARKQERKLAVCCDEKLVVCWLSSSSRESRLLYPPTYRRSETDSDGTDCFYSRCSGVERPWEGFTAIFNKRSRNQSEINDRLDLAAPDEATSRSWSRVCGPPARRLTPGDSSWRQGHHKQPATTTTSRDTAITRSSRCTATSICFSFLVLHLSPCTSQRGGHPDVSAQLRGRSEACRPVGCSSWLAEKLSCSGERVTQRSRLESIARGTAHHLNEFSMTFVAMRTGAFLPQTQILPELNE
ncbi:hypothetical protein IWX90DRAFT_204936 [Phyllosticta citrichinensis]|uniref:Uncharacterized protein n=1 Tax=Phyllosticta citrichinensis TaxID=1130410 RepID=A0ABR1XSD9_9PEZI